MPHWSRLRWLIVPLLGAGIAAGLDLLQSPIPSAPLSAADWTPVGYGPRDYRATMEQVSDQLELGNQRVDFGPGQWLRQESLARAYMTRSRFAVTYDDLAEANRILDNARADAPANSGPLLSSAVLGMMSHRLSDTEKALDVIDTWAVKPDVGEMIEVLGLRGDVAFYEGDMGLAERWYAKASKLEGGAAVAFRLANLAKARGNYDDAIAQFLGSVGGKHRETPFLHANTALQIGSVELARGNYRAASKWFAIADHEFPGFWLIEAHCAQSKAIAGDLPGAIVAMRKVAQGYPSAEVMDALAMFLRTASQGAESRQWAARAGQEWKRRLALAPEAAYGHALEHELVFGTPVRALDLAQRNLAARPYGESRLMLAYALVLNNRYAEALSEIERAEATGWRSAPLYALKAQVYELTGETAKANDARKSALSLNPRIFSPETALVWFAHG